MMSEKLRYRGNHHDKVLCVIGQNPDKKSKTKKCEDQWYDAV